jgi:hypothetical protein
MLAYKINPQTKRKEYALVSQTGRALKYFGKRKPRAEEFQREEERIQHYADKGKTT